MQICYKTKRRKIAGMEINAEKSMQQVTEKNQDKGRIRHCNESLTKIDTHCHCESFSLQQSLLEDILEEIDVCLLYPYEDSINERNAESLKIQKSDLPNTNTSDEEKLEQLKNDLFCNLRAERKTMLLVNEIDTNVNIKITLKTL